MARNNPQIIFLYLFLPVICIIFIYSFLFTKFSTVNFQPYYGNKYSNFVSFINNNNNNHDNLTLIIINENEIINQTKFSEPLNNADDDNDNDNIIHTIDEFGTFPMKWNDTDLWNDLMENRFRNNSTEIDYNHNDYHHHQQVKTLPLKVNNFSIKYFFLFVYNAVLLQC